MKYKKSLLMLRWYDGIIIIKIYCLRGGGGGGGRNYLSLTSALNFQWPTSDIRKVERNIDFPSLPR